MPSRRRTSRRRSAASARSRRLPDQQFQLNIQTKGRLSTVDEFENIVVRANPDGSFVRVNDVARVELAARSSEQIGRQDGEPAAVIGIYQSPGGNAIDSADAIRTTLERLKASFPEGVDYKITYDTTVFVKESINGVVHTLFEAFVLVVIVVFLFLGNVRATLIPLIAVPVSLIGTFAVMLALGYLGQHRLAAGAGAGHRHRRRRRDRRRRGRRARAGEGPASSRRPRRRAGDGRDHRADHRHHARAAVGVRAGRLHPRHLGRAVPAVRGRGLGVDGDLGDQRADAVAGAVRRLPARAPAARSAA